MEIRRLEYFVCTAELGSLGRASDALRIAQPALTRQVRLLEQELGVTLFTRTRRGMTLTEEGEQLLADVVGPLRQLEGALQNIRSFSAGISGNIAVGMTPTVAYFLAQPLLQRMADDAPKVALRIVEGTASHIEEGLITGELDAGVLYGPSRDDKLVCRELLTEEMVVIGAADSGLSADSPLGIGELTALPLILPNPKNGMRGVSERYAAKYNVRFDIRYVIDSFQVLKDMVGKGFGYTILPLSAVLREVESGALAYAPIENPQRRTLISAARPHSRMPRVLSRLDQVIAEVLHELHARRRVFGELKLKVA